MFFLNYVVFILIILFTHLIVLSTQTLSSNKYFFGVYVNEIIIEEDLKIKISKDYKRKLNISLLLSIIIYLILKDILKLNVGFNIIVCTVIYITFLFLILRLEYKKVKYIKETYLVNIQSYEDEKKINTKTIMMEDEILSEKKKKLIKKFKILYGICIGLSIISFLYVLFNYKNMPDIIITHWGSGGKPDGYSEKSILSVFFINFLDISMVLLFAILCIGSITSTTYIDEDNLEVNRKKAIKYLNGLGYSFLVLTLSIQAITSTIPIFMVQEKNIPMWLSIGSCIVPIFICVPLIYYYIMISSIKPKSRLFYTVENDDEKWIYGFIYYNKDDSKLLVEKRLGMGWNINMAHPLGKLITIILVVITVGSLLLCFI